MRKFCLEMKNYNLGDKTRAKDIDLRVPCTKVINMLLPKLSKIAKKKKVQWKISLMTEILRNEKAERSANIRKKSLKELGGKQIYSI